MERTADVIYRHVRDDIVRGHVGGGARLAEEEVAERFGVSRTPVREALRRLAAEGLVEFAPHRGARVMDWTSMDVEMIFDLRAMIEGFSAARAATVITSDQVAVLERICDQIDGIKPAADEGARAEMERSFDLNTQFHRLIADVAGGRHLEMVRGTVIVPPLLLRMIVGFSEEDQRRNNEYHRELVLAFRDRDAEWAGSVMTAHVLATKHVLMRKYDAGQLATAPDADEAVADG